MYPPPAFSSQSGAPAFRKEALILQFAIRGREVGGLREQRSPRDKGRPGAQYGRLQGGVGPPGAQEGYAEGGGGTPAVQELGVLCLAILAARVACWHHGLCPDHLILEGGYPKGWEM